LEKMNLGIVISKFNDQITSVMKSSAIEHANSNNISVIRKIMVLGAFEIPYAAKKLFESDDIDSVVVLGAVIKGKTDHDIVIVNAIASKLLELSLKNNKPLGFGVIGPGVTKEEAIARSSEYAIRAVQAVISLQKIKTG